MSFDEHQFPRACQDILIEKLRRHAAAYDEKIAKLHTKHDAERLRAETRRKLRRVFGPMPKRTPLNVRVTGTLQRAGYTIEKLIFESRPGFFVTANLYRPEGDGPFPAVLEPCGHSANGKAFEMYQALGRGFARKGFILLTYDPVSQGERSNQYGKACYGNSCNEHNMAGNQMTLVGEFFGSWRLWDGIRALDVLMQRRDVDKSRIGVTGCSGGGTLSSYLTAMDPRFAFAGPQCFVTDYLANLENELPGDAEQMPPRILGEGLDMADFIIAHAPRPTILMGGERDYFDARGLRRTFERVRKVYRLLGAANAIQLYVGDTPHGYWRDAREACYGFFIRSAGVKAPVKEAPGRKEKDETLFATPTGDVLKLKGARRSCDFIADIADDLAQRRKRVTAAALPGVLNEVLNLPKRCGPPHYRTRRVIGGDDLAPSRFRLLWSFALETEPDYRGVTAVLSHFDPKVVRSGPHFFAHPTPTSHVTLYVPHVSAMQDVFDNHAPHGNRDAGIFTVEPRGIGCLTAQTCNSRTFFEPYGADYFYATHGQMLGESYVGRRTHDVLAALDLLEARGAKRVHLVGRGLGAILAAFAAALHPAVKQVTLRNALLSFHELTQTDLYGWPASSLPCSALARFDLPDVYRALRRKRLVIEQPWNARMRPWPKAALRKHLRAIDLTGLRFR